MSVHCLTGRMLEVSRLATVGEIMSGVAHELNQPLTAIANFAQACIRLLAIPQADIAEVNDALHEISAQALRAGEIIRRIRELARPDLDARSHCDPAAIVEELRELILAELRGAGIVVQWSCPPGLPQVFVDRIQIQHALLNLVSNAGDSVSRLPSSERKVDIGVRALEDLAFVEFFVCDNGTGVDAEVESRLGEPFFTTKQTGTGLGLAIVNTIAKTHEGNSHYQPNQPNGACFVLRIPSANPLTGELT